jgi:hypothetical protein
MIIWLLMAESAWSEVQSSVGMIYLIFSVPLIKFQVSAVAETLLSWSAHYQDSVFPSGWKGSTVCPLRYWTWHFFNNSLIIWRVGFNPVWTQMVATSSTCYDVVTFLTQWGKSASNFVFRCNILISGKIIKEMPVSVASGTHCMFNWTMLSCSSVKD